MSVTLADVKRAARAHFAPLAGESAGYLVLALADQVLSAPRLIHPDDVRLTDDGGLHVLGGPASSETDAELSLRRALDGLLLVASSGSAALLRASRRNCPMGISVFVRELEAALIPVNRSAARRALARLQRETARALASGLLADDIVEAGQSSASRAPAAAPREALAAPPEVLTTAPAADEGNGDTYALQVQVQAPVDLPPALSRLACADGTSWDGSDVPRGDSHSGDALTVALEVRSFCLVEEPVDLDEDVEFIEEEPSDALTVVRAVEVQPITSPASPCEALVELPTEVCTQPEPIVLRRALRPLRQAELSAPESEALPRTPTLGSLSAELPVLTAQQIAELSAPQVELSASEPKPEPPQAEVGEAIAQAEAADLIVCSAVCEEFTEPMPDVVPLLPGVAIVASRKSEVSELVNSFQVAPHDANQGLVRALKEMAGLDLTPAPFAALVR